ncbi:glycosyltransferase family 4 protein [Gillisia sp. M10.2A]|uniref:Glycosyltransferase family 4 protein n=1 Tax=Gillisia lutea TaxID=2909668 RepID=A0ABS9EGY8_9FLAO|nr:glycosyltransferase family 4 protein [Gillisia lutea]MCF4102130.1 glycosyltransferase family 4 protein [Gillisia lutea]
MKQNKNIAVICNYELHANRIGGMDRFFVAYDEICKKAGFTIVWFFSGGKKYDFYRALNLHIASGDLENYFIEFQKEYKFDVVITHFMELCTSFYKQIKTHGNPQLIAVDHNPRPIEGFTLKKQLKNKIKGFLYSRYVNQFIGVSQYTAESIITDFGHHLKRKTRVIYNGVETNVYLKRIAENSAKFIVASHLRPSKGIQDLIKAVAEIPPALRHDLQIDIYGEGPMKQELTQLVKCYKLEKNIIFKGSVSNLYELYKHYSYLLHPTYMECFSLSILESLASNVPVVTTPVGGNEEIIEDEVNGYIFPTKDIRALTQILSEILSKKRDIKKNVSLKIEKDFTLQIMVENHFKILECI